MRSIASSHPIPVHIIGGGFPWATVVAAGMGVVVAFGAAYVGGDMQRRAATRALVQQFRIDAVADVLRDFGIFMGTFQGAGNPYYDDEERIPRLEKLYESMYVINASVARIEILGPEALATAARSLRMQALDAAKKFDETRTEAQANNRELGPKGEAVALACNKVQDDLIESARRLLPRGS